MMHVHHPSLPGYDRRQVWHDGCEECARRVTGLPMSVLTLTPHVLRYAWRRAYQWQAHDDAGILNLSQAELPLLRLLWSFQVVLERAGWPLGVFPDPPRLAVAPVEFNGRECPYYARYYRLEGADPDAICAFGCSEEPVCVTNEPTEGWPPLPQGEVPDVTDHEHEHDHPEPDGLVRHTHSHGATHHGLPTTNELPAKTSMVGCDSERCRWPFGSHAPTCAIFDPADGQ